MGNSRPFLNRSITDLEAEFAQRSNDSEFVAALADELAHRGTERAKRLSKRVKALRSQDASIEIVSAPTPRPAAHVIAAPARNDPPLRVARIAAPMPPVTNSPSQVVSAWTALEVLNPQTFGKPHELAAQGDRALLADLGHGLPWEKGDRGRRDKKLFYHVVIGTIDAASAFAALLERYVDARAERPRVKASVVLASVIVDKLGVPVPDDAVAVSSFGWGLPVALNGDLSELSHWSSVEERLHADFANQLRRRDAQGEELPLDLTTINRAYEWLISTLKLAPAYAQPPSFAIRVFQNFMLREPPDSLLLNSFFLGDLARAQALFSKDKAPKALRLFVGQDTPATRWDLFDDVAALEEAVAPAAIPKARWPGPGRYPLVLLQQAAVDLALRDATQPGILAVNGPPGTGKTTLLRDIVAALVTQRAEVMCRFGDPARAFSDSGQRVKLGQESATLYTVDKTLRGFEMLVASSNNGAVENVSAELPAQLAVATDSGLSYFKPLSDALVERPTWGLIAGILGNATNRYRFTKTFWWDTELGLATYLAEAAGTPQWVEDTASRKHKPRLIVEASAPSSHAEALKRWESARSQFQTRFAEAARLLDGLDAIRVALKNIATLTAAAAATRTTRDTAATQAAQLKARFHSALNDESTAQLQAKNSRVRLDAHVAVKPGFFARLFRTAPAKTWSAHRTILETGRQQSAAVLADRVAIAKRLEEEWKAAETVARKAATESETAETARATARRTIDEGATRLGEHLADAAYFERPHEAKHRSVPWCDSTAQRVRDDLFVAAMTVHKAFVDAAAKPLRGNLAGLIKAMGPTGARTFTDRKEPLLADVWATLFLVVPVLSTTFASVERMLGALPPETFGWLLIDEAGQAVPQAAVGAILRSRRAIVVGDPIQIEPVVPLPPTLTQTICRRFGIDPDRFNAPEASAQTLADAATSFMAEFIGRQGSRTVGVPLLVHRRCAEPMFGIANAVAYQRLMVQAKQPKDSPIRECLGPSRWIDVRGSGHDKWCDEEGSVVLGLLRRLGEAGVAPNLYVVSPFRVVAENLSQLIVRSGVLSGIADNPNSWVRDHVGTVHTVQGREAEAIIFVLGAPLLEQRGARAWAGSRPNLLNVALTRAQEVAYVVGNRQLWQDAGAFAALSAGMPTADA